MDAAAFQAFTDRLLARLEREEDVLGLVGLGSTSGLPPAPDAFSDHDLFLVVRPGAQERYRAGLDWLPDAEALALTFRETAHGVKALYASGHLVELAVFDPDELGLARVNRYRVLLDRADVAARLERVRLATVAELSGRTPPGEGWRAGMLLTALVVAGGRAARGEALSGHALLRSALEHLVALLASRLGPPERAQLDPLDPMRRVERALPEAGRALDAALRLPVPAAARALLEVLLRERPELVGAPARAAVERALAGAERAIAR
ncbi:MAG TPA: hypothetical protein VFP50_13855 [Anaeromyxobacteraceae bacterium]|nr:hypothetical protein [Anaeromyxobacteraceae bacterium]